MAEVVRYPNSPFSLYMPFPPAGDQPQAIEKLCAGDVEQPLSILPDGERLLDNYDLCRMLNISKRTLQRYRTSGELPYEMIYHKTFYRESDVLRFIERNFSNFRKLKKDRPAGSG